MNDVDFGFTERENSFLGRKQATSNDNTVLVVVILVLVVAITLFHFLVLPRLVPAAYDTGAQNAVITSVSNTK